MEIREATDADIPAIVELLKQSLGEALTPKSVEFWKWKHIANPFGKSHVLLCLEGPDLIGVRAFMQWQWVDNERHYKAVRAVDTASHPAFQGKGIFKKLTLKLVEQCKQDGFHFVFNTPNDQSRPGYLKMGWEVAGRLPVVVGMCRPFNMVLNLARRHDIGAVDGHSLDYYLAHPDIKELLVLHRSRSKRINTLATPEYLQWRYLRVPVAGYLAVGNEDEGRLSGLIIARIKLTRFGRELRITDCFTRDCNTYKTLHQALKVRSRDLRVDYITSSGVVDDSKHTVPGFKIKGPIGPAVTIRSLLQDDLNKLKQFSHWSPSIGDLELF